MTDRWRARALGLVAVAGWAVAGCDGNPFEPSTHPATYVAVAAGGAHSCGLAIGGELYCWGRGGNGQLGNGEVRSSAERVRVSGVQSLFTSVTLGQHHTCATGPDDRAYCWGWNRYGQLGDGTTSSHGTPAVVATDLRFAQLSAGFHHTCGVTLGGDAYCWGDNGQGQLGSGGTGSSSTPVQVAGGIRFAEVSAGGFHTCGLTPTGEAYCWGLNYLGQLGTGDTAARHQPALVAGGIGFNGVSAGAFHSCGATPGGQAYCWGSTRYGELGNGHVSPVHEPEAPVAEPQPVYQHRSGGELAFTTVDAGLHFTCATDRSLSGYCWGLGYEGQLGSNDLAVRAMPQAVFVTPDMRFTRISTGHGTHACAATDAFGAYCWGTSPEGGIGPRTAFSGQPVRIP